MPTFISPIPGALVTSGWGDPREYRGGVHRGLDFRAAVGTPVKAIASGKIFHSGSSPDPNAGKWVGIDHGAWSSRYLHLDQPLVAKGASVAQGEIIGYSGSTGVQRSAPHLHFDLAVKDLSAYPLAIAGALLGEKKNWGWQVPADRVFCISARRNLNDPAWDAAAAPRHDFDEFKELQQLVVNTINQAGYVIDRRIENVRRLRDFVFEEAGRQVLNHKSVLSDAAARIAAAEKKALEDALVGLQESGVQQLFGLNVLVYQKLAQRWLGPMGWMIAIWARLLIFGSGLMAVFRFGRPVRQVLNRLSALKQSKESQAALEDPEKDQQMAAAFRNYRLVVLERWPDIARSLVRGGFESSIRKVEDALSGTGGFEQKLAAIWSAALDHQIDRLTAKLSGLLVQVLFNLPAIGILGYCGWLTLQSFFSGEYLSGDFFMHAFWAIGLILFLSFFILQLCIRAAASTKRIAARVFEKLKHQLDQLEELNQNPVKAQLDTVLALAALAESNQQ